MLKISTTADLMRCAAGEPIAFEVQLADDAGVVEVLRSTGRSLVFVVYDATSKTDLFSQEAEVVSDASGDFAQWIIPGTMTDGLRGKTGLMFEVSERLADGRDPLMTGTLMIDSSAPVVASYGNAPTTKYVTRIKRLCDPTTGSSTATYTISVAHYGTGAAKIQSLQTDFTDANNAFLATVI